MADAAVAELFRRQKEDPANAVCCDCGTPAPEWASVSHGVYLSIGASGVHRSLGVRVSFVQSLSMDSWKPVHLRMMELGGNQRFSAFLREQGVPEDAPIRKKYNTRAAEWYRKNLRAEAEGSEPPPPLSPGVGSLPAAHAARGPETRMLDRVFAEAPSPGAAPAAAGAVPRGKLRVAPCRSPQRFPKKEEGRPCDLGPARHAAWCARAPGGPGRHDAAGAALRQKSIGDGLAVPLTWLLMSEGDRAAEKLRTMSTGRMPGFGPEAVAA